MGRYFTAPNGNIQLNWILATKVPERLNTEELNFQCYDLEAFSSHLSLFPEGCENLESYEKHVKNLNKESLSIM